MEAWPLPDEVPLEGTDRVAVRNEVGGMVAGAVVQAGTIHGDVHVHASGVLSQTPRQLPGRSRYFVNRKSELSALTHYFIDAPLMEGTARVGVIDGMAGVGKTALAIHWAYAVQDKFPDGQLYVNLLGFDPAGNPLTPAEALQVLLEGIGVPPDRVPATQAGRMAMYRSLLAGRRVLVLLDNALESTQVEPLLPGSGPGVTMVTSRHRLDGLIIRHGAERILLGTLGATESRGLLSQYVGAGLPAPRPQVLDEIAARCGHLPLALSIVAARARYYPELPPDMLVRQLRETEHQLDALDAGDVSANIRDVLSWSYRQLPRATARVFRLLSMHPGPDISIPAAESLAAMSNNEALRHLRHLTRANLLEEYVPARFRFHDLLRAYAGEQAQADDPADTRGPAVRRFLDGFLFSACNASSQLNADRPEIPLNSPQPGAVISRFDSREEAMKWFKEEYQNLNSVIEWTAANNHDEYTWRLALAFWQYLYLCGRWHELIGVHETALAATARLGDSPAAAAVHANLGLGLVMAGRHEEGAGHFRTALDLHRAAGNLAGEGSALDSLAWIHVKTGEFETAISYCDQALAVYRQTDDPEGQARALDSLGVAYAGLGRCEEGIEHGQRALELHVRTGSLLGQIHARHSLGRCYALMARYQEAASHFEQAVAACRDLGDRHDEAAILRDLGAAAKAAGEPAKAEACWTQAAALLTDLRHPDAEVVEAELQALRLPPDT